MYCPHINILSPVSQLASHFLSLSPCLIFNFPTHKSTSYLHIHILSTYVICSPCLAKLLWGECGDNVEMEKVLLRCWVEHWLPCPSQERGDYGHYVDKWLSSYYLQTLFRVSSEYHQSITRVLPCHICNQLVTASNSRSHFVTAGHSWAQLGTSETSWSNMAPSGHTWKFEFHDMDMRVIEVSILKT